MGPSAVVLEQPGKWTIGILVNNLWSVAGHSNLPDVNQFLIQYFINYNLKKGWYLTWQPTLTANWQATNGGRWIVPMGGGVGRIMRLGFQPVNIGLQFYANAVHPPGASPGVCGCKSYSCTQRSRRSDARDPVAKNADTGSRFLC